MTRFAQHLERYTPERPKQSPRAFSLQLLVACSSDTAPHKSSSAQPANTIPADESPIDRTELVHSGPPNIQGRWLPWRWQGQARLGLRHGDLALDHERSTTYPLPLGRWVYHRVRRAPRTTEHRPHMDTHTRRARDPVDYWGFECLPEVSSPVKASNIFVAGLSSRDPAKV